MAVLMAFALVEPDRQFYLFPLPMPITARALVLIVVVMNIITGLGRNNEVSVETHFGGLLAGYVYIRMAPWINSWQRNRHSRKTRPQSDSPNDKLGEAVDNIFKFEDRHRR